MAKKNETIIKILEHNISSCDNSMTKIDIEMAELRERKLKHIKVKIKNIRELKKWN